MIGVVRREIVAVPASEARIFLKQSFLNVEAEGLGFAVLVVWRNLGERKLVDISVAEKVFCLLCTLLVEYISQAQPVTFSCPTCPTFFC